MGSGGRRLLRHASELGPAYEATLDAATRRRGAHYTPAPVAAELVELTLGVWERGVWERGVWERGASGRRRHDRRPPGICDPACGGGAFLLAALDALVRRGIAAADALVCVRGIDTDPGAVEVSRASVRRWIDERSPERGDVTWIERALDSQIVVGDGLLGDWPGGPFDVVVGNPPFQSQLRSLTARDPSVRSRVRELFGDASVGYVDTAALFLLSALRHVTADGTVCLVQPRSTAGAAHAAEVRRRIAEVGVVEIWWPQERLFDAAVDVWAPVISARPPSGPDSEHGEDPDRRADNDLVELLRRPDGWSDAVAARRGVPALDLAVGAVVSDVATVSAGFRDEFYGLIPYVDEQGAASVTGDAGGDTIGRLVTVGAIEPLRSTWGERPVRFAGRSWDRPVVGVAATDDPTIGEWVRRQLRPKVVLATQTRWVEAVADPDGTLIGVTPAISITPHPDLSAAPGAPGPIDVEHLAVALCSPVITLVAHRRHAGTALVADAVRLSAAAVRSLPLPSDRAEWDRAVGLARRVPVPWRALGEAMCAAYGVDVDPVLAWWLALPAQRGSKGV